MLSRRSAVNATGGAKAGSALTVRCADTDGDGESEIAIENQWLRALLRCPRELGEGFYKRRFTWGGRLQSLVYRPSAREWLMTRMIDLEDINPFGLPDELFATWPLAGGRRLKMGVGVLSGDRVVETLPWTWHEEEGPEGQRAVVFRQEVEGFEGFGYVYEKRYRFCQDAAWLALDVAWENRGQETLASAWDVHTFHPAGAPPHTAWLVAPKRAWVRSGNSSRRVLLKEASSIFSTPDLHEIVADRIDWDADGGTWWYATGPAESDEFCLVRSRGFTPDWGMFWAGYGAFTPQAIMDVVVPPGVRATWGLDITLGRGGRDFVSAGERGGLCLEVDPSARTATLSAHLAAPGKGCLRVWVEGASVPGAPGVALGVGTTDAATRAGATRPEEPLVAQVGLPANGDFCLLAAAYEEGDRVELVARELVALRERWPTARLPFPGRGERALVAVDHQLDRPEADGRYLLCHGTQAGLAIDWTGPGVRSVPRLEDFQAVCLVGDAWPSRRARQLRDWVEAGGGLLVCAPFGSLASALGDWLPLRPLAHPVAPLPGHAVVSGAGRKRYAESEWRVEAEFQDGARAGELRLWRRLHTGDLERVDPVVGLRTAAPHSTARGLMLEPDAKVRIGHWVPAAATPGALVTLRYTDPQAHPAVALRRAGAGRVAAVASRVAWGASYRKVVWDGWGQYHRAFWAGLVGWLAGCAGEQEG